MGTGTSYEHTGDGWYLTRRYHECKKCHDRVYTKEPNFQECMSKASEKYRNN